MTITDPLRFVELIDKLIDAKINKRLRDPEEWGWMDDVMNAKEELKRELGAFD